MYKEVFECGVLGGRAWDGTSYARPSCWVRFGDTWLITVHTGSEREGVAWPLGGRLEVCSRQPPMLKVGFALDVVLDKTACSGWIVSKALPPNLYYTLYNLTMKKRNSKKKVT